MERVEHGDPALQQFRVDRDNDLQSINQQADGSRLRNAESAILLNESWTIALGPVRFTLLSGQRAENLGRTRGRRSIEPCPVGRLFGSRLIPEVLNDGTEEGSALLGVLLLGRVPGLLRREG